MKDRWVEEAGWGKGGCFYQSTIDNLVGWKKGRRGVEEEQGDLECFALRLE